MLRAPLRFKRRPAHCNQLGATVLEGEPLDGVAKLKRLCGRNIGVHGSPTLVEALVHAGLLDELPSTELGCWTSL